MQSAFACPTLLLAIAGCTAHADAPRPAPAAPPASVTPCPPPSVVPPPPPPACERCPACVRTIAEDAATGTWSPKVGGIRGRLLVSRVGTQGTARQLAVGVELENVSGISGAIELWWTDAQSALDFALADEAGNVVPKIGMGGNHLTPLAHWFELESESSVRFTVSTSAYEYPSDKRVFLRPTTFQAWDLTALPHAKLYLSATLRAERSQEHRRRAWTDSLALPRVPLPD